MSIPVALDRLEDEIDRARGAPYLLTVGDDGRPHCVSVALRWDAGTLLADVGRTTAANATGRPLVAVVWPPRDPGELSLIVDATAATGPTASIRLTPTSAVLHRGPPPDPPSDRL
ncbi:MAG TPA: hypothetical protein VLV81_14055 [Acidimicrobiia bacterium]|nr:hypothetical protein [Acidimicrobiia bacterium]